MEGPVKIDLKPQLQQRLAPQLIQSLRLLQLPTLELEQVIRQELENNPMLEEVENQKEVVEDEPKEPLDLEQTLDEEPPPNPLEWNEHLKLVFDESEYGASEEQDWGRELAEKVPVQPVTLTEHLLSQLRLASLSEKEYEIGEGIIGNVNADGYLSCPLKGIAQSVGASIEEVEKVLRVIQTFDPPGIGARDLRECLMIQLRDRGREESLAMKIVRDHLGDLERRCFWTIAKALGVKEREVHDAVEEIATLNPKPGWGTAREENQVIVPDLIVEKVGDDYIVLLNEGNTPSVRISPYYRSLLEGSKDLPEEAKKYLVEKFNSARWLLRAIQQRRSTLLTVVNYMVQAQREFLEHGVSHLKPMVMQEVADALGVHVSTVSRVTANKYIQTPRGIFELKYFFDGKIGGKDGEDVSAKSVKVRILELIENEDPQNPLSDQQIANLLNREGLSIARRTVAKYREELKILPARYRKRPRG